MSEPLGILRRDLVAWTHRVAAKGWVANHDGNLSRRLPGGRLLATPTSFAKADVGEADLLVTDRDGKVLSGKHRIFSEIALHLACYGARPDVGAVVHAHPPYATAHAVAGRPIDPTILAEAVVSLGDAIPLLPPRLPGSAEGRSELAAAIAAHDVVLLGGHGVLAVGDTPEQAYLRVELAEHLATVLHHALPLGGARSFPPEAVRALLDRRRAAGLGPEARRAKGTTPAGPSPTTMTAPCSGARVEVRRRGG